MDWGSQDGFGNHDVIRAPVNRAWLERLTTGREATGP
jgi:hypothetical protein